jgi:hypothetical protein
VTSTLGQGCNAALESARVLGEVLDAVGGDAGKLPEAYSRARLKEVHALQTLEHTFVSGGVHPVPVMVAWAACVGPREAGSLIYTKYDACMMRGLPLPTSHSHAVDEPSRP